MKMAMRRALASLLSMVFLVAGACLPAASSAAAQQSWKGKNAQYGSTKCNRGFGTSGKC
jgi:hypothetical protein